MMEEKSVVAGLFMLLAVFALAVLLVKTYVGGKNLITKSAETSEITGTYRLILYGAGHGNDMGTVAILDKEDDLYTIDLHAPPHRYSTKKNLSAKEALEEAKGFISWHYLFQSYQLRKVMDERGTAIAYEMRPLYRPETFGVDDIIETNYTLKKRKVSVSVALLPSVEQIVEQGAD
ncbi:MAG: hypothetical protein JSV13_00775 [Nitrospiraceae bacterium]|nr:MAG: hypothetical protein JSV13_00775 [Nitrospiraceae bacterium]